MVGQEEEQKTSLKRNKILSMARKLKALADRGIGGEKDTAKRKYDEYCLKHGLSQSDVEELKNHRVFTIQFEDDALVLSNVIYSINPATKIDCTELYVKCILDDEDFKECVEKYRVFIKAWRKHKDFMIMVFMTKHADLLKMDDYAYAKFTKSNQQKNMDVAKAEEQDAEMKDITDKLNGGSKFGMTSEMIEKENEIKLMNRMLPHLPNIRYRRVYGGF